MSFALLLVYITLLLLRPQEWYAPLAGYELVNVAAISTIFVTFISQGRKQDRVQALFRNKYARLMLGLLASVVLSQLTRFRVAGGVDAFKIFGKIVVLFGLTMILADSPERLRKILWLVVLSAALLSVSAVLQVQRGYGFGDVVPFGSFESGDFRVQGTGTFGDPNDFAMLYLMATAFVFSLVGTTRNFMIKGFLLCLLPGFLYTLYYTQSRGAVVGFCALLLGYLWGGGRASIARVLLSIVLLAGIVAFGPTRARETVYEGSAGGRIVAWGIGNEYLKQAPLFGIGFSRWGELQTMAPHNSFVQCYAELGLVGYFFWFALCWLVIRSLYKIMRLKAAVGAGVATIARGLFAALLGYLASAFFLTHAYDPPLYFMLAMGIGLVSFAERQPNFPPNALAITGRDLRWSLFLEILSIPAIWLIARIYWAGGGGGD